MTMMTIEMMMMLMIKIKPSKIGVVNGYDDKKTFKDWVCLNDLLLDPGVLSTYRRQVLGATKYIFSSI